MSYPVLQITGDYAFVEIRKGRAAERWEDMALVYRGSASRGDEWKGAEGEKLWGCHCLWPSDPNSTLSQPYDVSSRAGLAVGQPRLLRFPTRVGSFRSFAAFESLADEVQEDALPRLLLHEDPKSGNCYKIKLTTALLGLPLETRQYDILNGETRTPEFLENVNSNGRIPVLQIGESENARFLPESNAACWYLASGSDLIPDDRFAQADMLRWMFFEQYQHEPNVATLRFWLRFVGEANLSDEQQAQIPARRVAGQAALELLDGELADRPFLCGEALTLADITLFAYSHLAGDAGFELGVLGNLSAWIERVKQVPGFAPMD
ncbi:glutathione S-transferase [uncultured Erythrobacter sp.]|uniref:glutathione S-transferase family protein n=1 Tax=uncultured Erythrobacter sp. TaxID=263913 RepID=UPI00344D0905